MGCVLRVFGSAFDSEAFLKGSKLSPSKVWRRGEPSAVAGRGAHESSGMNVAVSEADMKNLGQQASDAMAFMNANKAELVRLLSFPGLDEGRLDFAVSWRGDVVTHTDYLPTELVRLAGELGLGIEISHYPVADEAKD